MKNMTTRKTTRKTTLFVFLIVLLFLLACEAQETGISNSYQNQKLAIETERPKVLIILDKSSEMAVSGKWEASKSAINSSLTTHCNSVDTCQIEFGLELYPLNDKCQTESIFSGKNVEITADSKTPILSKLDSAVLEGEAPMEDALNKAASYLEDLTGEKYILLISAGPLGCSTDTTKMAKKVEYLFDSLGVITYVIGLGTAVDAYALNQIAVAGGTAILGCDSTSPNASAVNNCYLSADNTTVSTTLETVASQIIPVHADPDPSDDTGSSDAGIVPSEDADASSTGDTQETQPTVDAGTSSLEDAGNDTAPADNTPATSVSATTGTNPTSDTPEENTDTSDSSSQEGFNVENSDETGNSADDPTSESSGQDPADVTNSEDSAVNTESKEDDSALSAKSDASSGCNVYGFQSGIERQIIYFLFVIAGFLFLGIFRKKGPQK